MHMIQLNDTQQRLTVVKQGIREFLLKELAFQQLSQYDLSLITGQSHTTIGRLLSGDKNVRLGSLVILAYALGYRLRINFEKDGDAL